MASYKAEIEQTANTLMDTGQAIIEGFLFYIKKYPAAAAGIVGYFLYVNKKKFKIK